MTAKRPKLPPASDEVKRVSALLGEELIRWPGVSAKPMFGLRTFYYDDVVFAMLPEKRGFETPGGIAYKIPAGNEKREGEKWKRYEIRNERDFNAALEKLSKAYERAVELAGEA